MSAPDLFGWRPPPSYPETPGRRRVDTSIEAAEHMADRAATLREACLALLRAHPSGLTADEVARHLNESPLSIRPRMTELKRMARIADSGRRRRNRSGRNAAVMVLTPETETTTHEPH